jgi:hypothetical protein
MKTSEARNLLYKAVTSGRIDREEAARRHSHITRLSSGPVYGSAVSWQTRAKLIATWVEDLR